MERATSLRDKIAFRIIRFGFRIATRNNPETYRFRYALCGDLYTFESLAYRLTKTNGEQYPCNPDIFEKTYEMVGEDK